MNEPLDPYEAETEPDDSELIQLLVDGMFPETTSDRKETNDQRQ